jgi:hypothetical protein
MFPSGTGQSGKAVREPLRLIKVQSPESPEQFMSLGDDDNPPVAFVFNRPLTAYETRIVLEIKDFQNAEVSSDGAFSDTGQGIVTVTLPFGRLRDTAKIVADISGIPSKAANLEAYHRERLTSWQEVAADINKTLQ